MEQVKYAQQFFCNSAAIDNNRLREAALCRPSQAKPMRIAANGLIRLSIEELLSTPITHLVSGVDVDDSPKLSTCGKATSISGYTEWVSTSDPIISIGWDCPAAMSC